MKVLFCSSEVVPFAKTGGLADVSGALPLALQEQGAEVKIALPKYRGIKSRGRVVKIGETLEVYLIENDRYFNREGLYGNNTGDYPDNLERFAFFCEQILHLLKERGFCPEIIHCNDWQTALIPVYLKTKLRDDAFFSQTKTIFTIHNLAYQGIFLRDRFIQTHLDERLFNKQALEFYGKVNLLKGGLVFSDFITTVSPTYAQEIQTRQFGCRLEGVLRKRREDLLGIINGIDYKLWNPAADDKIFQKFGAETLKDKYINKRKLQQELNLSPEKDVPLLGMIGRLTEQKGIDLVISCLAKISGLNLQFIILGTGEAKYHLLLEKIKQKNYGNISINLRFDSSLAHKIYAGCDMFLMPSNFEPCGLGQLISLKYGTIPIVRKTGGLADTVIDYNPDNKAGNGLVFTKYTSREMLQALMRAIKLYKNKKEWCRLMLQAMKYDFSWETSAQKYIQLYNRVMRTPHFRVGNMDTTGGSL